MIRRARSVMDVAALPDVCFGPRDIMWWGTLCFMVIEGFTLVLCAVVYVYVQKNLTSWPPLTTPLPSLAIPTVELGVMLASIPVTVWLSRRAHEFDLHAVRTGLTIGAAACVACTGLGLGAVIVASNVRWDTNAYGSVLWLVVGAHITLLLVEMVEFVGVAAMFWIAPIEKKHFSDASDVAFYWYFIVASWVVIYVLCFLLPHWG